MFMLVLQFYLGSVTEKLEEQLTVLLSLSRIRKLIKQFEITGTGFS